MPRPRLRDIPETATESQPSHLPDAVRELLPQWRQRFSEIEQAWRMPPARLNRLRWQFGKEIAAAIGAADPITPIMRELAARLECSRGHIYSLLNVGKAFDEPLPLQHWSTLSYLTPLENHERAEILSSLGDWAAFKDVKDRAGSRRPGRERALTPQGQEDLEERARREALVRAIRGAYEQLPIEQQFALLIDLLVEMDPSPLAGDVRELYLLDLDGAVAALRNPAPGLAAEGATLDGADDVGT